MLIGASVGGRGSCWAGKLAARGSGSAPIFQPRGEVEEDSGWTFLEFAKILGV